MHVLLMVYIIVLQTRIAANNGVFGHLYGAIFYVGPTGMRRMFENNKLNEIRSFSTVPWTPRQVTCVDSDV